MEEEEEPEPEPKPKKKGGGRKRKADDDGPDFITWDVSEKGGTEHELFFASFCCFFSLSRYSYMYIWIYIFIAEL